MKTYPIKTIDLNEAQQMQFELVDCITQEFEGKQILQLGDLGVVQPHNMPLYTRKIENVLANFFDTEDAILVRGSGTGALRYSMFASVKANKNILVHDAPIYPTTKVTIEMLGLKIIKCNFNDIDSLKKCLNENIDMVLVQYTRQKPDDKYDYNEVIKTIHENSNSTIITDDNYAAMKVEKLGASICNGLSTFSSFKLQGPQGIGVIVGNKSLIEKIRKMNYSGGCQVQGFEANEVLRGLVCAPVLLATQSSVVDQVVNEINSNPNIHIKKAFVANAQSKVIIVELNQKIAKQLIVECEKLGACNNPVGAESKFEISPMFYKVSATFIESNPSNIDTMIRINPMRAGYKTILRILNQGLDNVS